MIEIKRKIEPFKEMNGGGNGMAKRWKAAALKYKRGYTSDQNSLTEHVYHQILTLSKTLYSRLPEALINPVFEKNYKEDNTENAFTLHSFLTPNFYWSLECSFDYFYRINYDFHHCPFELEVMSMIERNQPYLPIAFVRTPQMPSGLEFYKSVLAVQEPEYIYLLTENSGNLRKLQQT